MWLNSVRYRAPYTYEQVRLFARDYLEEKNVPEYFQRLRQEPGARAPPLNIAHAIYFAQD